MFGNQYRYGVEVANEETGVYETVSIVNEVFELAYVELPDEFRVVVYRQDKKGIYRRGEFVEVDLKNKEGHARNVEVTQQLNIVADIA